MVGTFMIKNKLQLKWIMILLGIVCITILWKLQGGFLNHRPDIDFKEVETVSAVSAVTSNPQALRVAVSSVLSPKTTIAYYRSIANYLGEQLGRPVILIQRENYSEIGMLLLNGGADIAFFSGGEYAAYSHFDEIQLLVGLERHGLPYYQGYLVVPKDSPVSELSELRGKSVAFTDPLSYSGYAFLASILKKQNEMPERFFGRYMYTYSHDKSLRAVASKVVDAASVTSFVYDTAKITMPEVTNEVKIIAVSPPMGIGPVVVSKKVSLEEREILRNLFLNMSDQPRLTEALRGLMIDKFILPQPDLYHLD